MYSFKNIKCEQLVAIPSTVSLKKLLVFLLKDFHFDNGTFEGGYENLDIFRFTRDLSVFVGRNSINVSRPPLPDVEEPASRVALELRVPRYSH